MYGKIFSSMYDGTLRGNWKALVTFQQMIVLCDIDGVVDMTTFAIHGRTGIPLEIIEEGIKVLEEPDPYSRTSEHEGRRIARLDAHRPWGWVILNYKKYRHLTDAETVRAQNRERQRKHRDTSRDVTHGHTPSPQVEAEVEAEGEANKEITTLSGKPDLKQQAIEVLNFLNEKTGRRYQPLPATLIPIITRLKEGATVQQCRMVIAKKCREWGGNPDMVIYLRPKTLFNRTNFANYVGELGAPEKIDVE